ESRIKARGEQPLIEKSKHGSRLTGVIHDDLPNGADRQRAVQRGRRAFARNIAQRETETANAVRKKIVEISAQRPRGDVSGREVEAGHFPGAAGQKLALNFPRRVEVVPKLPFALAGFFVEPGV